MTEEAVQPYVALAEVRRGNLVESLHFGAAVVCDAAGSIVASLGSADQVTYPRSALKAFQALPLVESGAADALGLEPRHLALSCASHRAEPFQVELVKGWMERLGLDDRVYACGPAWPRAADDRDARVAGGERASSYFHNCSGKHTGMLSVCLHEDLPVDGYGEPGHPLQQRILSGLSDLVGRDIGSSELGTDGCNLPAIPLSMREMATIVARFAAGQGTSDRQSAAMRRLLDAMRRHPDHVSGRGQATQVLCQTTEGRVLMKTGAEGYLVAWLPEDGLGIAIKTSDGGDRVRVPILIELLSQLDLISKREVEALEGLRRPMITNSVGRAIGSICGCFGCRTNDGGTGRFRADAA